MNEVKIIGTRSGKTAQSIAEAYKQGYRDAQSKLKPMCKYLTKCMSHPDISRDYHDWCVLYGEDCNCQCCSR